MATRASRKSLTARSCRPRRARKSLPVSRPPPSSLNNPISTAVNRTFEFQKPNAVCRIGEGSKGLFMSGSKQEEMRQRLSEGDCYLRHQPHGVVVIQFL